VEIARLMFTNQRASYNGRYYTIDAALNLPRPSRGTIPILVAGSGERQTLRIVAELADAANVLGGPQRTRHLMHVLDAHCEAIGRDPAEITRTHLGSVIIAPTHEAALAKLEKRIEGAPGSEQAIREAALVGDPDSVGEQACTLLEAGLDGLIVSIPDLDDPATVEMAGRTLAAAVAIGR
jgi:alkanesulfonate monooxygenase SsuD/methylene tetrahydromethanopterin reductase-like flavin-dependent oxidoreductase (luciferase family)